MYDRLIGSIKNTVQNAPYNPVHTLIRLDENFVEISRYSRSKLDNSFLISAFLLDYEDIGKNYVMSAESSVEIAVSEDSRLSKNVPFLGKENFIINDPLVKTESQLEVSDLILGINTPELIDMTQYPFPVIPVEKLKNHDKLAVYFEIYHLTFESDGIARYQISYQVVSQAKQGIFARLFKKKEQPVISISADYFLMENRAKEHITFDVSDLEPADYEFKVTVTDLIFGQEKTKSGNFTIIK